uniref:Uncharacterized protein n=1 Tax=Arundo donax TaxID=35708 RepID=A0A0A8YM36_ARUDO
MDMNGSEMQFSISLRVPEYTTILNDGSRTDLEAKDHVLEVNIAGGT